MRMPEKGCPLSLGRIRGECAALGRGLAEHWGALKYTQALAHGRNSFLGRTDEGHRIADHYKSLQSGELGIGFALTLTEHMLGSRFPDHSVTIVPADTALRAGWALTTRDKGEKVKYRYRPQNFAEVWRPEEPSLVIPLACKGNHSDAATSAGQLASASAHAEAVHIGAWNETPGLLFSTQLPTDGGTMTVHALQALGSGGRLSPAEGREPNLNAPPFQANVRNPYGAATCRRRTTPGSRSHWPTPRRPGSWPSRDPATPPPGT
ncbi:hypothetical protein [Streptomyces sp. NPDC008121]|uniref:hypothetical protein n=1 Tax=Streptomyces sp. NPDC008121 TaxID=3364809 RepID=UPI0036E2106B